MFLNQKKKKTLPKRQPRLQVQCVFAIIILSFSFIFTSIKVVIHVYMAVVVKNIVQSTVKTTCVKYNMENVLSAWLDRWDLFAIRVKNLRN